MLLRIKDLDRLGAKSGLKRAVVIANTFNTLSNNCFHRNRCLNKSQGGNPRRPMVVDILASHTPLISTLRVILTDVITDQGTGNSIDTLKSFKNSYRTRPSPVCSGTDEGKDYPVFGTERPSRLRSVSHKPSSAAIQSSTKRRLMAKPQTKPLISLRNFF